MTYPVTEPVLGATNDLAVCPEYRTLALCAGAGGLELGVELARPGARCVAYVEREAYAAGTLVARMETGDLAPALIWSDLATFDARPLRGRIHCVTSGDPCQPNSNAGRRLGAADDRFLLDRAIQIYADSGADRFFRENVTGNADGQLAVAVPALERLGCRVAVCIIRASDTGSTHQRERLVIMADRDGREFRGEGSGSIAGTSGEAGGQARQQWFRDDAGQRGGTVAVPGCGDGGARADVSGGETREGPTGELGRSGEPLDDAARRDGQIHPGRRGSEQGAADAGGTVYELVYSSGIRWGEGRTKHELRGGGRSSAGASGKLGDTDGADVSRRRAGGDAEGRQEPAGYARLASRSLVPAICPGPSDVRWLDILDADPLLRPALGRIDIWAVARRNLGLPPVVAAIGRRGGMAWDLDAETTAFLKCEVRRISDVLAGRVDPIRLCGNGVQPLALARAWLALDALLAEAAASDAAVRSVA